MFIIMMMSGALPLEDFYSNKPITLVLLPHVPPWIRFSVVLGKLAGYEHYVVEGEPTVNDVQVGLDQAKANKCDCVVSIGGGSAIDAGKLQLDSSHPHVYLPKGIRCMW